MFNANNIAELASALPSFTVVAMFLISLGSMEISYMRYAS